MIISVYLNGGGYLLSIRKGNETEVEGKPIHLLRTLISRLCNYSNYTP